MSSRSPERRRALALGGTLGALAGVPALGASPVRQPPVRQPPAGPAPAWTAAGGRVLRVCADPNNLPFSDSAGRGFENRLAELVAGELHARVSYTWWAQRRGFVRNTLKAGLCDVVMGVPAHYDPALTTRPYYRSSYVFLARPGTAAARVRSFDDPAVRRLKIGVQVIGDDFVNSPPAHALGNRGIVRNVVGYNVYGDYREVAPPRRVVDAVARREVDLAVAWGPMAGYWAARRAHPLAVRPVSPAVDPPGMRFVFDVAAGVRRGDPQARALRDTLDAIFVRRRAGVDRILAAYRVPRLDRAAGGGA